MATTTISTLAHYVPYPARRRLLSPKASILRLPSGTWGSKFSKVPDRQEFELGRGVKIRIMPTCGVDSLMVVSDDEQTCVNLNDSLHSAPVAVQDRFVRILLDYYPKGIDYVFCGYGVASHFPNCYILPGKDREATAAARQAHFNRNWARIIQKLAPKYGFPFAAEVVLLDHMLFWANEPIHNSQRPTDVFRQSNPGSKTEVIDCAPGFMVENRQIRARETKQPLSTALLSREYAQEIEKANRVAAVSASEIKELAELLRQNVALCKPYLVSRKRDYSFLVQIRNAKQGIGIYKKKSRFEVVVVEDPSPEDFDLTYITRFPYLKNSLVTKHGYEVLFVGSGGVYQYRSAAQAWQNLQRDFAAILTRYEASPNTYNRRGRTTDAPAQAEAKHQGSSWS